MRRKNLLHLAHKALGVSQIAGQLCFSVIGLVQYQADGVVLYGKALDLLILEQYDHLRVTQIIHMVAKNGRNDAEQQHQNDEIQCRS